jgi:capping protein alpha
MSELSQQDIIQIANGFLLASPPGEFSEVINDVRGLLQNDDLLNKFAVETFHTYNTEQMIPVSSGDHEALIAKQAEVNPNEYIDPLGGVILTFDHIKQKVTNTRPISNELDSTVEPFRRAIEEATVNYITQHYGNGVPGVYSGKEGSEFKVIICISSSKFNPNSFWNGRWRSTWTVIFKPGSQAKLEGNIKINVHYYEDGNVQLVTNFTKKATLNTTNDPKALAEALLKQITKLEQDYQTALDHSYNTMGETTFKALRRALPMTREKIQWEKIQSYKVELAK